ITSTFTCEPVAESVEFWMQRLEQPSIVRFAPYNQVFQQLLDPTSLLRTNQLGLNTVIVRFEDWARSGSDPGNSDPSRENIERTTGEFVGALRSAAGRSSTPYLVCICPPSPVFAGAPGRAEFLARMEETLRSGLEAAGGVYLLGSAELRGWYPVEDFY